MSREHAAGRRGLTCDAACEAEDFRADGRCVCEGCGLEYSEHPYCEGSYSTWAEVYVLHVVCDGRHVKL